MSGRIREIAPEELPQLDALYGVGHDTALRARLEREMRSGKRKMYVWQENNEPLGGMSLQKMGKGEMRLSFLVVREDKQGRGIGGTLVDEACRLSRAAGCTALTLEVRLGNLRAMRLYLKKGFREEKKGLLDRAQMRLLL